MSLSISVRWLMNEFWLDFISSFPSLRNKWGSFPFPRTMCFRHPAESLLIKHRDLIEFIEIAQQWGVTVTLVNQIRVNTGVFVTSVIVIRWRAPFGSMLLSLFFRDNLRDAFFFSMKLLRVGGWGGGMWQMETVHDI